MLTCVPVLPDGRIDPRWGRAATVAIAQVDDGRVTSWQEFEVGWDELHDVGTEGGHHARVARFLMEHRVQTVAANHMGHDMLTMLNRMGLTVRLGASGDAREAAVGGQMPETLQG
jgi:predicted Fe-Mo cluster-binding NifX family protein